MRPGRKGSLGREICDNLGGNLDADLIAFDFSFRQKRVRKLELNLLTTSVFSDGHLEVSDMSR